MGAKKKVKKEYEWKLVCPPNKYSCQGAADFLGLHLHVIYSLRRNGVLPFIEFQSMYFFEKKDLLNWIMQNQPERMINQNQWKGNLFSVVQHYLNILIMFLK
jgi:hypothetical protein